MSVFEDDHDHELLSSKFCRLVRLHRRMTEGFVSRMNSIRKVGINTPKIYGHFSTQSSGYDKVGFRKRKMYNQIGKQCQLFEGDANGALLCFRKISIKDLLLYIRHEEDSEGALRHPFWVDKRIQIDYAVFRDVLLLMQHMARINISVYQLSSLG